jgi:DNA-binding MarR family transcriptional regulator
MTENLQLVEHLVRVQTRLWNQLDRVLLADHQVSMAWLVALRVLQATPGTRVQDLADHIDISPGGASKLVDRLVAAGLVDREIDADDRRVSRLRLTAQGRRAERDGSRRAETWLAGRFGPLLAGADGDRLATALDMFDEALVRRGMRA